MGPYNGTITYPGQIQRCFICNRSEHQAKDCFDHKAKTAEILKIVAYVTNQDIYTLMP